MTNPRYDKMVTMLVCLVVILVGMCLIFKLETLAIAAGINGNAYLTSIGVISLGIAGCVKIVLSLRKKR